MTDCLEKCKIQLSETILKIDKDAYTLPSINGKFVVFSWIITSNYNIVTHPLN